MSDAAIYWAFAIAFLAGMVIIGAHQFFGLRALEDRGEWAFDFWIGEGNVLGWWTAASLAAGGLLLGPVQSFAYLTWLAAEIYVLNAVLSKPLEVGIVTMAVIVSLAFGEPRSERVLARYEGAYSSSRREMYELNQWMK